MTLTQESNQEIPLFISQSNITTEVNKTGSWRFVRPVYTEKTAPCSAACPAGEDIARIEMLVSRGLFKEAWELILMENPFPAISGRVCFHNCEGACNRAGFDQSLAIHHIERFLGDTARRDALIPKLNLLLKNEKKIAIVGAGPAGLSAAYFLACLGYKCDIFEASSKPGGLLRWGIPEYRLPVEILESEIARIESLGVKIHCNHTISHNFIEEAKEKYDALFIGCGYGKSIEMKIPGEEFANDGLKFLFKNHDKRELEIKGTAAIIGGGNTAIDLARSLIRFGVKPVIVYRRRKQDMPAFEHEIEMALKEGVELKELLSPVKIEKEAGNYILSLQEMKVSNTDGPRAQVIPDNEKIQMLKVQNIFTAIGAKEKEAWLCPPKEDDNILNLSHCALIKKDFPMAFGGDLINQTKSVTDAIASGKQAAIALDIFFKKGWDAVDENISSCQVGNSTSLSMEIYMGGDRKTRSNHIVSYQEINIDYFHEIKRIKQEQIPLDKSIKSFSEIDKTFSTISAMDEAKRCFNCGICNDCDNCRIFCPEIAVSFSNKERYINMDYCKGCGICVVECPRNAMALEDET
ncbi:FAD/NAD(P)-binding domain-containing protein [Candidatus Magnetomoraceae bacterium gMMP-15]